MMKRLFMIGALMIGPTGYASAEVLHDLPIKVTTDYIIPGYEKLVKAAQAQNKAWQQGCRNPGNLVEEFHRTSMAWAHIQHINYGPVTLLLRRDRLYHWPERRNAVSKALGKLMKKDDASLAQDQFSRGSVAGQGLPALERLIYEHDVKTDTRACKAGQAIARNILDIAKGTARDWQKGDLSMLEKLQKGQPHDIWFDSNEEVAHKFFTEMLAGFQMISDQKILLPMGKDIHKANGKRSEAWRSGLTTWYIRHNVDGLIAMAETFKPWVPDTKTDRFNDLLVELKQAAKDLPDDFPNAVTTEDGRVAITSFKSQLRASRDGLIDILTNDLGLVMGFNSLDGD